MTQKASETKHPTDDELEAMAVRLEETEMPPKVSPCGAGIINNIMEAVEMLRACKGGRLNDLRAEAAEAERDALDAVLSARVGCTDLAIIKAKSDLETAETNLKEAISVLKDMRDDKTGYRHAVHFRRRAAVYLASLEGDKG